MIVKFETSAHIYFLCLDEDEAALKKSAVINWYLKEIESEIESEMELISKKAMIEKVLHRLVHYVSKHIIVIIMK